MTTLAHHHLRPVRGRGTARRRILLTGASGVLGQALLPRLADHDVVCLTHRAAVPGTATATVRGDLTKPGLGLDRAAHRALLGGVDAIVHCAAVTDFNRTDGSLEATNVDGTRRLLELADAAEAPLTYVSTAFLHATGDGQRGATALRYAASKRAAEQVVRNSGLPHLIVRPPILIGDAATGDIAAFQGIYGAIGALLRGHLPIVPFAPHWRLDFLPVDAVAEAIAALVEHDVLGEELWLTAGPRALTLEQIVGAARELGAGLGIDVPPPRFVPPETFDRLIAPVFLPALPVKVRATVTRLLELFAAYTAQEEAFPSAMGELGLRYGLDPVPDLRTALLTSLRRWAAVTGLGGGQQRSEVV